MMGRALWRWGCPVLFFCLMTQRLPFVASSPGTPAASADPAPVAAHLDLAALHALNVRGEHSVGHSSISTEGTVISSSSPVDFGRGWDEAISVGRLSVTSSSRPIVLRAAHGART